MNKIKIVVASFWTFLLLSFFSYLLSLNMPFLETYSYVAEYVTMAVEEAGIWGGILFIIIYTIRPLIFFPATILTALAGALFGPIYGVLYTIIGENFSANVAFRVARYFRKKGEYQKPWLQKLDSKATKNGFITTLILRLIWAPFDGVNYSLGLTRMKQRAFALGTFIGILPGLTIFVLLGDVIGNGSEIGVIKVTINIVVSLVLFIASYYLSKYLKNKHKDLDELGNKSQEVSMKK